MANKKKHKVDELAEEAVGLMTGEIQKPRKRKSKFDGETSLWLYKLTGEIQESAEFESEIKARYMQLLTTATDRLLEALQENKVPASSLAFTIGLIQDKFNVVSGKPTQMTAHANIEIDGKRLSREDIINLVSDDKPDEVINLKDETHDKADKQEHPRPKSV